MITLHDLANRFVYVGYGTNATLAINHQWTVTSADPDRVRTQVDLTTPNATSDGDEPPLPTQVALQPQRAAPSTTVAEPTIVQQIEHVDGASLKVNNQLARAAVADNLLAVLPLVPFMATLGKNSPAMR